MLFLICPFKRITAKILTPRNTVLDPTAGLFFSFVKLLSLVNAGNCSQEDIWGAFKYPAENNLLPVPKRLLC